MSCIFFIILRDLYLQVVLETKQSEYTTFSLQNKQQWKELVKKQDIGTLTGWVLRQSPTWTHEPKRAPVAAWTQQLCSLWAEEAETFLAAHIISNLDKFSPSSFFTFYSLREKQFH